MALARRRGSAALTAQDNGDLTVRLSAQEWCRTCRTFPPAGLLIPLTEDGGRLACFVVGIFVLDAGVLVYNVTIVAWRQAYVPPQLIGRVVATMRFLLFGTIPLGGLLGGALAGWIGVRARRSGCWWWATW